MSGVIWHLRAILRLAPPNTTTETGWTGLDLYAWPPFASVDVKCAGHRGVALQIGFANVSIDVFFSARAKNIVFHTNLI